MASKRKAKRFCFTLNNYSDDEFQSICTSVKAHGSYGIVGKELGEFGTPHLQGFVIFRDWHVFGDAKDRLNSRCHVEVSRGTPRQNRNYCSKGGDFTEFGECPASGSSSGKAVPRDELVREFNSRLESGYDGMVQFAGEYPGTFGFSGFNLLRNYQLCKPSIERPDICVRWFFGGPGVGKSRKAHEELPKAYVKDPRTKWWNGYLFERDVIIDDFGPGGIDINHLLRWFDRYKCLVESKGSMLPLYACNFIVTSNFLPCDIYKGSVYRFEGNTSASSVEDHPQLPALMRRITIVNF